MLRRVAGKSMEPALTPGKIVFALRPCRVGPGDVVVFRHGGMEKIKRIKGVRDNEIFLTGDNRAHSTDSRDFGWLESTVIVGKVIWPNLKRTKD